VKRKEKAQAATGFSWTTVVPKGNWQGNHDGSRQ